MKLREEVRQASYLPIRIAAAISWVPIIWLRNEISNELTVVFMTMFFYLMPYVAITFCPSKWAWFPVGFGSGYAASMQLCIWIYEGLGGFMPVPGYSRPTVNFSFPHLSPNVLFLAVSITTWLWNRRRVDNFAARLMSFVGLFYPVATFFLILFLANAFSH
jgi:hypothetical protein